MRLLQKVLDNLLGNAAAYSPAGNRVLVKLRQMDDQAKLTIENTGVHNARLEYTYTMSILAADKVMVKDYCDTRDGVQDALRHILYNISQTRTP